MFPFSVLTEPSPKLNTCPKIPRIWIDNIVDTPQRLPPLKVTTEGLLCHSSLMWSPFRRVLWIWSINLSSFSQTIKTAWGLSFSAQNIARFIAQYFSRHGSWTIALHHPEIVQTSGKVVVLPFPLIRDHMGKVFVSAWLFWMNIVTYKWLYRWYFCSAPLIPLFLNQWKGSFKEGWKEKKDIVHLGCSYLEVLYLRQIHIFRGTVLLAKK